MVMTYKQGLPVLAVSFLAVAFGSCTYNEDDLRGAPQSTPQDSGPIDLATAPIEADANVVVNSPIDAEGVDVGPEVDVAGGGFDTPADASEIDASADAFSSTGIDAFSSTGIDAFSSTGNDAFSSTGNDAFSSTGNNDSGGVDEQSVDVSAADTRDLWETSPDSDIDVSAVDVQVEEDEAGGGGIDGADETG
jgi:hypothetical protein